MKFIKALRKSFVTLCGTLFPSGDPVMMDHVSLKSKPVKDKRLKDKLEKKALAEAAKIQERTQKALEEAEKKHGKQFHAHKKVSRVVEPSRDLMELNALSAKQYGPVKDVSSTERRMSSVR